MSLPASERKRREDAGFAGSDFGILTGWVSVVVVTPLIYGNIGNAERHRGHCGHRQGAECLSLLRYPPEYQTSTSTIVANDMSVNPRRLIAISFQLVTLPYNLLLQKSAREALGFDLKDQVVVIDEAHSKFWQDLRGDMSPTNHEHRLN
jgi:hypothetical protein